MIESVDRDITAVIITPFLMFGEPEKRWPIFPKIKTWKIKNRKNQT